jgi:NTE family protein
VSERTRVAVALGSGGARGYAHIGVLDVLRERGYEVVSIAGTSMGAVVGGLAAAGRLGEFEAWARTLTQRDVWRLLDPTLLAPGAFRADRVLAKVAELVEDVTIEDLPIPYTAVATDLEARREVWFQRGPLVPAIRASVAIPGVITPVVINGRLLVDGGLMNPVPIEPTAAAIADFTVAVSLAGMRSNLGTATPVKESSEERPREEWAGRLRRSAAGLLESERFKALSGRLGARRHGPEAEALPLPLPPPGSIEPLPEDITVRDLLNMSFDTMSALISRYRMASTPPDVLVTVPVDACRTMDFHKAADMIVMGRELAEAALDRAGY